MFKRLLVLFTLFTLVFVPTSSLVSDIFTNENEEQLCMAQNIYFEARNQSLVGQLAVAQVVMNRVKHKSFPDTICGVVHQGEHKINWKGNRIPVRNRCHFSWYCDGLKEVIDDQLSYDKSLVLAHKVMFQDILDITEGSLYYHTTNVDPYWNDHVSKTMTIDDHIFYR